MPACLTPRQREVLAGIVAGKTTRTLAQELGITMHTLESHREALYRRINVHCIAEAIAWAYAHPCQRR